MKKFLLLSAAVCMALSMSAQKLPTAAKATLSADKTLVAPTFGQSYAKTVLAKTVLPKKVARKAEMPTVNSISGLYVCDNLESGDGSKSFTKSQGIQMEQLEDIVVVEGISQENPETYNCNVVIYNLLTTGTETYAVYDQENGTLTIPSLQLVLQENYDYYFVNCLSINEADEVEMNYSEPVVLTLEEDANGWYFVNNPEQLGFALVVFDDDSNPVGFGAVTFDEVAITPCNYINDIEENVPDNDSDWQATEPYGVFLEMIDETSLAIHGFMNMATVNVTIDEEGLGKIATLQPVIYANLGNSVYDYLGPVKWAIEGGNIKADANIPYIECGFAEWTFNGDTEDEYKQNCFALYDYVGKNWEYYSLGRDGMQGAYMPIYVFTMYRPIDSPALTPEAIKTATATPVKRSTFNLAGQRVNNAKGLVIENGKKVVR